MSEGNLEKVEEAETDQQITHAEVPIDSKVGHLEETNSIGEELPNRGNESNGNIDDARQNSDASKGSPKENISVTEEGEVEKDCASDEHGLDIGQRQPNKEDLQLVSEIQVNEIKTSIQNESEAMETQKHVDISSDNDSPVGNEEQTIVHNDDARNDSPPEINIHAKSVSSSKSSQSEHEDEPLRDLRQESTPGDDGGQLSSLTDYSKEAADRLRTTDSTETNLINEVGQTNVVIENTPTYDSGDDKIEELQATDVVIDVQGNKKSPLFIITPQKKLPVSRVKNITTRLRKDTESSAQKQSKWYKGRNYVDANCYHWTNMALRGDYQSHMWTDDGAIKGTFKK